MTEDITKPSNNKALKVIIAILAVAIIAVGAMLLVKTFAPPDEGVPGGQTQLTGSGDGEGKVVEITEGEDGEIEYNFDTEE